MIDTEGYFEELDESTDRYNIYQANQLITDETKAKKLIKQNRDYQQKVARGIIPPCDEGLNDIKFETCSIEHHENYTLAKVCL